MPAEGQKGRASLGKAANPIRIFTYSQLLIKTKKKRSLIPWKTGGVALGAKEQEKDNCYWNISSGLPAPVKPWVSGAELGVDASAGGVDSRYLSQTL